MAEQMPIDYPAELRRIATNVLLDGEDRDMRILDEAAAELERLTPKPMTESQPKYYTPTKGLVVAGSNAGDGEVYIMLTVDPPGKNPLRALQRDEVEALVDELKAMSLKIWGIREEKEAARG